MKIAFGTDGWRAKIAREFTFKNVAAVAQAYADTLKENSRINKGIAVAWDTRFLSSEFARLFAEIVASNGITVLLSETFTATPVLSFTVKDRNLAGGVMITASHNPHTDNGIKFKDHYGGPVMDTVTRLVESQLFKTNVKNDPIISGKYLSVDNFDENYIRQIKSYLNTERLSDLNKMVVYDSMYGAGQRIWKTIASELGISFITLHDEINPQFGDRCPEPILYNLPELQQNTTHRNAILGIATDGDADRFGIIDEKGQFVELHDLIVLLFEYLVNTRNWDGSIVRSSSMANTIDKSAIQYNRTVEEVPVGFKYICDKMIAGNVLIGGEESGGIGFKNHIPERDGILSSFLVLEMLASMKKPISEMVNDLRKRFGPFHYNRIDKYCVLNVLERNMKKLQSNPPHEIDGYSVTNVITNDGVKLYFGNDTWMLIRISQTESLGRIYVGSNNSESVEKLLQSGVRLLTTE
ncbi:MAG: phosphoglucomutase/phosphomannomutase family protein [Candidatus Marinimicrobia bacterium]|nr:phosphoglucomutase/phosphomannomutase family protein [Candidatus Neomarinimicrobiota bacterium]